MIGVMPTSQNQTPRGQAASGEVASGRAASDHSALGQTALENVVSLLDLEVIEVNIFRGRSPDDDRQRIFGGQVAGQALVAAARTVDHDGPRRGVHSLHAYFLRPGDPKRPVLYEVDRIRDGRSFTTRRVVAIQHGRAIFQLAASFHVVEGGYEHFAPMPDVPDPETLQTRRWRASRSSTLGPPRGDVSDALLPAEEASKGGEDTSKGGGAAACGTSVAPNRREAAARPDRVQALDLRYVTASSPLDRTGPLPPRQQVWMKANGTLGDDPLLHHCLLTYASDMTLLDTTLLPHGTSSLDSGIMLASLDHAMWFHGPFRADEWLLYDQYTPAAAGARGLATGRVFTHDGRLVASVVQEGLIRRISPRQDRKTP